MQYRHFLAVAAAFLLLGVDSGHPIEVTAVQAHDLGPVATFTGHVWADNWFELYVGEEKVAEDPVPITTERSFNAEELSFEAEYPFQVNVVLKDFKENDSGLEYIGARNQQMGDGGFIAQFFDAGGRVIAVTDRSWSCLPIHRAPLNKDCENSTDPLRECRFEENAEPEGWKAPGFDTSDWQFATEFSEAEVRPRGGYDRVEWDPAARLIWTTDLETDNTLLCKATVSRPHGA